MLCRIILARVTSFICFVKWDWDLLRVWIQFISWGFSVILNGSPSGFLKRCGAFIQGLLLYPNLKKMRKASIKKGKQKFICLGGCSMGWLLFLIIC